MKRASTPSFVATFGLRYEPWQRDKLDKLFRVYCPPGANGNQCPGRRISVHGTPGLLCCVQQRGLCARDQRCQRQSQGRGFFCPWEVDATMDLMGEGLE